jgi:hypothetical protein
MHQEGPFGRNGAAHSRSLGRGRAFLYGLDEELANGVNDVTDVPLVQMAHGNAKHNEGREPHGQSRCVARRHLHVPALLE